MLNNRNFLVFAILIGAFVGWGLSKYKSASTEGQQELASEKSDNSGSENKKQKTKQVKNTTTTVTTQVPSNGVATARPGNIRVLESRIVQLDPNAKPRILTTDSGQVTTMSGFKISRYPDTEEGMLDLARELVDSMGLDQAVMQHSEVKLDETPDSKAFQYDQTYQGYDVLNSYIKIFTKKPEGFAYFVSNETKDVGQVDLRIDYSLQDAMGIVRNRYQTRRGLKVTPRSNKSYVHVVQPGQSEMVWLVEAHWENPLGDRRQLVVSAKSGSILTDISLRSH